MCLVLRFVLSMLVSAIPTKSNSISSVRAASSWSLPPWSSICMPFIFWKSSQNVFGDLGVMGSPYVVGGVGVSGCVLVCVWDWLVVVGFIRGK